MHTVIRWRGGVSSPLFDPSIQPTSSRRGFSILTARAVAECPISLRMGLYWN